MHPLQQVAGQLPGPAKLGRDPLVDDNAVELPGGQVVQATRLKDSAEWDVGNFAIAFNAVQISKLVLLDGSTLNDVIKDGLGDAGVLKAATDVQTYTDPVGGPPANVMIDALTGTDPWLVSIDSDHAWRQDARPIDTPRDPGVHHGGNGSFPLWESCLARPVFRTLFHDWEPDSDGPGGTDANFGDLGDAPSADPTAQPAQSSIAFGGSSAVVGPTRYLGANHTITVTGNDPVFTDPHLSLHYRTYPENGPAPAFQTASGSSVTFSLPANAADGPWVVEYQASNPCIHPSATGTKTTVVLDRTPPSVTITSPAEGAVFDVNQTSPVAATFTDGGAGVDEATKSYRFDGSPVTVPHTLDMFTLAAGLHTVQASAEDLVDNLGTETNTFELRPTSAGILSVMDRAFSEGLVTKADVLNGLKDKLSAAAQAHEKGKHATEANLLYATLDQLAAQRGKSVAPSFADRLRQWTTYLLASE